MGDGDERDGVRIEERRGALHLPEVPAALLRPRIGFRRRRGLDPRGIPCSEEGRARQRRCRG